jgi:uncharacterized membrane protein YdbT with pleckstrin-like domain
LGAEKPINNPNKSLKVTLCVTFKLLFGFDFGAKRFMILVQSALIVIMTKVPLPDERILFKGHPAVIGSVTRLLIVICTLGIGAIWFWLKSINTQYLITSQRIVIETGIFSREIETLEIYQIDDVHLEKPLNQRIMGTGNILLLTRDLSAPQVLLERMPIDVRELYEQMRPCIQQARFRFHVRDEENPREIY